MTLQTLRFGTRGSLLARRQTSAAAEALTATFPQLQIETRILTTKGDRELDQPLPQIGGKGLFTAELEAALHQGEIDLAVHSLKDLPTEDISGLMLGAILSREHPGDLLISQAGYSLETLPVGATVGTSSLRRGAQLLAARPDLNLTSIRGNIDTRLSKALADNGAYKAIVLAAAGLNRLGLNKATYQALPFDLMLPAPGQGAIAIQCRTNDPTTQHLLTAIDHLPTRRAVVAERAFLATLNAGCSLPVAALGTITNDMLTLQGLVASLDGRHLIRLSKTGPAIDSYHIGSALATEALAAGAQAILEAVRV